MFELVTGGSGSGKSEYAETRAVSLADGASTLIYIAAMKPYGKEGHKRIERHRKQRAGRGFITIEKYTDYASLKLPENSTVLFECLPNALANEMFDEGGAYGDRMVTGISQLIRDSKNFILVTDEVFSDGISYSRETEEYKRMLAELNRYFAARADRVTEVAAGIPYIIKGTDK